MFGRKRKTQSTQAEQPQPMPPATWTPGEVPPNTPTLPLTAFRDVWSGTRDTDRRDAWEG